MCLEKVYQIHSVYLFGIASIAFVMTNAKISLLGASQTLLLLFKIKEVTKSKMTNRARKNGLYFGLTDEEKLILDTKKKRAGFDNTSEFIRCLIRYCHAYKLDYSFLKEYNERIRKIGTEINEITRKVYTTGDISEEEFYILREKLHEIQEIQQEILKHEPELKII